MTDKVALLAGVTYWNAGVNVILYRNGNDHIAYHSDTSHNEELIGSVLLSCCEQANRPIVFKSKHEIANVGPIRGYPQNKATHIKVVLHLQPGDVYYMNKTVQEHFEHGVEKLQPIYASCSNVNANANADADAKTGERLVVVCRYGTEMQFKKDSGQPQLSLMPKLKQQLVFGDASQLVAGCWSIVQQS